MAALSEIALRGPLQWVALSAGTTTITSTANTRVRVFGLLCAPTASTTINVKNGTTTLTGDMTLTGLLILPRDAKQPHLWETDLGASLNIVCGGTNAGTVWYTVE